MIRRRSYQKINKYQSNKYQQNKYRPNKYRPNKKTKKNRKSLKKKRNFGTYKSNVQTELSKNDGMFKILANFINPVELIKLFIFAKDLSKNTIDNIHLDESVKLSFTENAQILIIRSFKSKIKDIIKNLSPSQIILILKGKYNYELTNMILFRTVPMAVDVSKFSLSDKFRLFVLKSWFGKNFLKNIKNFLLSLSSKQFVLLANGRFDLNSAIYNALLNTKYPTLKDIKEKDKEEKDKEEKDKEEKDKEESVS